MYGLLLATVERNERMVTVCAFFGRHQITEVPGRVQLSTFGTCSPRQVNLFLGKCGSFRFKMHVATFIRDLIYLSRKWGNTNCTNYYKYNFARIIDLHRQFSVLSRYIHAVDKYC